MGKREDDEIICYNSSDKVPLCCQMMRRMVHGLRKGFEILMARGLDINSGGAVGVKETPSYRLW